MDQALVEHCFLHFYGLDVSNAAIHTAPPRFSPITFRLQEALDGKDARGPMAEDVDLAVAWHHVRGHNGKYEEDKGR